jgi:hypothetical protein
MTELIRNLDIPLTVGLFLMLTGILTWLAFAIIGCWHTISLLQKMTEWAINARQPLKIYREYNG